MAPAHRGVWCQTETPGAAAAAARLSGGRCSAQGRAPLSPASDGRRHRRGSRRRRHGGAEREPPAGRPGRGGGCSCSPSAGECAGWRGRGRCGRAGPARGRGPAPARPGRPGCPPASGLGPPGSAPPRGSPSRGAPPVPRARPRPRRVRAPRRPRAAGGSRAVPVVFPLVSCFVYLARTGHRPACGFWLIQSPREISLLLKAFPVCTRELFLLRLGCVLKFCLQELLFDVAQETGISSPLFCLLL